MTNEQTALLLRHIAGRVRALAAAYRRDPDGVRLALKTLGVVVEKESAPAD